MDEEFKRVDYEEEEVTTIHRKTIRKQTSTTRRKNQKDRKYNSKGDHVKTEIQLSPFIVGAKKKDTRTPDVPPAARQSDHVHKLVQDTLNEYKGTELPRKVRNSNRVFLGAIDSDEDETDDDNISENEVNAPQRSVWKIPNTGKQGLDRFRRVVEFVMLAQHVFTCKRTVTLNRQDSILFFMDRQSITETCHSDLEPKFDVNAFKSLGQKNKMSNVKSCLVIPPSERTDGQINHMVHTMRSFKKFSSYPQAVQTGLCRQGWYARFESSKVIVKEGSRAEFYYLILSGLAVYRDIDTVYDELDNSKNKMVASYMHPGDTLGEKEILTDSERPSTVVCKEPVEVLGVDRDALLEIFHAAGGLGSIDFLKTVPEICEFPLELLPTQHFSMAVHYYRRGTVIVKSSNESEWIYIVRSGSCQVYKAIRDGNRKEHTQKPGSRAGSRPSSGKKTSRESGGLVLPMINKAKNENLKSASVAHVNDVLKSKEKKRHVELERSNTCTALPSLKPGKTSMIQSQQATAEKENKHTRRKKTKKDCTSPRHNMKKIPLVTPGTTNDKRNSGPPDILRLSRNESTFIETPTPDSMRNSRRRQSQSPSSESMIQIKMNKKSTSSSGNESLFTPITPRKFSNESETDVFRGELPDNNIIIPEDTSGSMFYVRLSIVMEKGVFGIHPLVYDDMPNLSLVSSGAECVLISKQFLKDHMTKEIAHRLRNKLPPYPRSSQLRSALDDQLNWENYREKVVSDVLK